MNSDVELVEIDAGPYERRAVRDAFAGQAMRSLLGNFTIGRDADEVAELSYRMAAAMMRKREIVDEWEQKQADLLKEIEAEKAAEAKLADEPPAEDPQTGSPAAEAEA